VGGVNKIKKVFGRNFKGLSIQNTTFWVFIGRNLILGYFCQNTFAMVKEKGERLVTFVSKMVMLSPPIQALKKNI